MTKQEITKLVKRYLLLKQRQDKIEKELKAIRSELLEVVKEAPDRKMYVGKHTLFVSDCVKKTVSFNELFKAHPRIANKIAHVSEYAQLNVK